VPTPHLDGKHVVFGKVTKGKSLVRRIQETQTDTRDSPLVPIIISDCGEIRPGEDEGEGVWGSEDPSDPYEDYPDLDDEEKSVEMVVQIAGKLKELGNEAFKAQNYERAIEKYQKVRSRSLGCLNAALESPSLARITPLLGFWLIVGITIRSFPPRRNRTR